MSTQSGSRLPAWCAGLEDSMERMALSLAREVTGWTGPDTVFVPEDYGYIPGEKATAALRRAVEAAARHGGIVRLEHGDYVSGTLVLESGVCLEICPGARLLASTDLADYPEHHAKRLTVQDTSMGMHQSLIFAEGCHDICLRGGGIMDGQGTQDHFPGDETAQGTPGRPFLIRMIDCTDVHVANLTLKNAACWMQNYLNCGNLLLEDLTVRNHANWNNDGMDIDSCRNVVIRRCRVFSGDDALCFKGAGERELARVLVEDCDFYSACNAVKVGTDTQGDFRQVYIRRCRIGGLEEDPSGLKHPCADSGISLEMVDGGTLEDFLIRGVRITRAWSPFFMRLENRGRVKPGDPAPAPGVLRRILVSGITGDKNGPRGSYLMGIPEQPIRDIVFSGIELRQEPSVLPVMSDGDFPGLRGVYPDAHMIDAVGNAPAYALWARHVRGLYLSGYSVLPDGADPRPAFVFRDVHSVFGNPAAKN